MTHVDISRDRLERLKSMGVADYLHMALLNRIEELEAKLAKAVEALELAINACDQGRMVTRPGCGVGGMTIEENIRSSIYINVPAWPIEEARAALAEINGGGDT